MTISAASRKRHVTKKGRTGPFVKYVGAAEKRTISATDWRTLGIELKDPQAVNVWSAANDFLIESSAFSEEQLDHLLIDDVQHGTNAHSFIEVERDSDGQLVQR
jgi:hypothetical protein